MAGDELDKTLFGSDLFGESARQATGGALSKRFTFPPFTVLDARQGEWQNRKRAWIALGIRSELGRGIKTFAHGPEVSQNPDGTLNYTPSLVAERDAKLERDAAATDSAGFIFQSPEVATPGLNFYRDKNEKSAAPGGSAMPACDYSKKQRGDGTGKPLVNTCIGDNVPEYIGNRGNNDGGSIFDPVLAELMYKWFCPPGGQIVDPFAGGSVRGLVAGILGFKYWGCDLRAEQIDANIFQLPIAGLAAENIKWITGDSCEKLDEAPEADFIFSCPPYGDLERYSDDPQDLSTMEYNDFLTAYRMIILQCSYLLKPGCMACFVVGDFRDKKTGNYRGFPVDTVNIFRDCGLPLYNDAILVTCVGSLPVRVSNTFDKGKKLGKTHQNVLVFKKPE